MNNSNTFRDRLKQLHDKVIAQQRDMSMEQSRISSVAWPAWTQWTKGPPWRNGPN
ncbi:MULTISPECIES: hypothetical protein [Caballeronia]|uniref:Uncharacterized protein n=3 Tax=Caballeronia TaxID=1827195 RepID=A0AA37MJL6_9BURK|nr:MULTISPECIES: hypothetical protein [Caballeronia]GJH16155.1 hypothetical protein CBA19CS22_06455 [Caballeronia novacaledonica]GJH30165.1 hypothetical protein CBA19CS42_36635 [Caballeronia novacaledonica]